MELAELVGQLRRGRVDDVAEADPALRGPSTSPSTFPSPPTRTEPNGPSMASSSGMCPAFSPGHFA
ncbi:hypothetical protein OHA18_27175 [Kribbella sp. NBC_00709]|uniref:hypothetical protein n=1 Tax=Kribbella sp. NBC_00709 TaxID=2975972 RepID=UPI002E2C51A4|nr:hypothetical protein [Kribbella sp. NBC_00709]